MSALYRHLWKCKVKNVWNDEYYFERLSLIIILFQPRTFRRKHAFVNRIASETKGRDDFSKIRWIHGCNKTVTFYFREGRCTVEWCIGAHSLCKQVSTLIISPVKRNTREKLWPRDRSQWSTNVTVSSLRYSLFFLFSSVLVTFPCIF